MPNKIFERELQEGLRDTTYYFWGDDALLLEDALKRVIDRVIPDSPRDFNCDIFYPSSTVAEIRDAITTVPFMAKRRVVVLKDFHQFPEDTVKDILPCIEDPPDTTCVILLSMKAPPKGFNIKKTYNLTINEKEMPSWVKGFSLQKGIRLTDDAIDLLLEFTGYDTGLISMEIEKLTHLKTRVITEKEIINSVTMMRQFTSFEFIDSLLEGKKAKVLRIIRAMFDEGNAVDVATSLLGVLNWHYREFYNLWLQKGEGFLKMNNKRYRLFLKHLPLYNESRFFEIFRMLHEADVMIKTGSKSEFVIETLLIKLLQHERVN